MNRNPLQFSTLRRMLAEETFAESSYADRQKWDAQVYFFCRLLVLSGTLRGPAGVLTYGAGTDGTEVSEISESVMDDAEAYIIEYIIRDLGNVTEFEHVPMAHAVLREFDSAIDLGAQKDRVALLIAEIADRVTLDESGVYVHRAAKSVALRAVK